MRAFTVLFALWFALPGCGEHAGYRPGLGEIMTLTQMRHAKLWFAGAAENWPLAEYEANELEEGLADVLQFHPRHEGSPMLLTQAVPEFTAGPLAVLRTAIAAKDAAAFTAAFDRLTSGCNSCHIATKFACNVVVRPQVNTFSNQDFTARSH